jgi:hypothetical protein
MAPECAGTCGGRSKPLQRDASRPTRSAPVPAPSRSVRRSATRKARICPVAAEAIRMSTLILITRTGVTSSSHRRPKSVLATYRGSASMLFGSISPLAVRRQGVGSQAIAAPDGETL